MIKKFEQYNNDIDPYGEEWWGDDDKIIIGSVVQCIQTCETMGIQVNNGEHFEVVKFGNDEEYFVQVSGKADLIKSDFYKYYKKDKYFDSLESDDKIIKYEGVIPVMWPKHIFIKIKSDEHNESINLDIDPYGEEDWNDEKELKDGDIVTFIDGDGLEQFMSRRYWPKLGNDYEIEGFFGNEHLKLKGISPWLSKSRFVKKKMNESINNDIDPYEEEEWGDEIEKRDTVELIDSENAHYSNNEFYDAKVPIGSIGTVISKMITVDGTQVIAVLFRDMSGSGVYDIKKFRKI